MRTAILALLLPIAVSAFFFGNSCGCQQRCPTPVCAPPQAPVCPPPPVCGGGGAYAAPPQQFQPQPVYRGQPQQVQPQPQQYYQQLPAGGYAVSQQAQPAEFGDEALAAQSENHEFPTNGQSATLETEESPSVAAPSEQSSVASDTTPVDDGAEIVDTNEAAPQTTAAQNTVYDDIVNAAQSATPTVEYSAAASSRRRYHSIRRAPAAAFDPKCNSETLKTLIHENIGDSTSSSKRAIQKAASEEIGGHVDVICSTGTFSYIVNTELYCETEKDGITCFAFRQSN
ncbi:hypothetical protein PMAYCL1PPCAC_30055 [Pristionchus mayeri]|uniref:Ground-like domain-containing protein n=1 Tax=Pristionchus mayeri TaxID=1317129 RepID=A0AAN5DCZ3_9BILA|nr:hypothetical protein PMAYCL1PPCAC_30055 [Pristionchus mayeri]